MSDKQPISSSDSTNWDSLLKHSSAIGILKPDVVFGGYGSGSSSGSSSSSGGQGSSGSSGSSSDKATEFYWAVRKSRGRPDEPGQPLNPTTARSTQGL
ncbi:hypothetical protein B0T17DRAFT_613337 [Bombardia bombarda]|uniref:Uncharacterized protein n=1 Tax=Bombardia bombarda TaxID=252184 RepID=A0AA39XM91_9PEZI|nr:hypothetical protein B0T17DRAFT_613337 [Bombardia bombarda]